MRSWWPLHKACGEIVADALIPHGYSVDPADYHGLHKVGHSLIEDGRLHGAAALCLLESTKHGFDGPIQSPDPPRGDSLLFHGSPVPPEQMGEVIEPRSCRRLIIDTGETEIEPPRSSHSSNTLFPKIRALLHHDHPDLQGVDSPLVFSRKQNKLGAVFYMTFRKVLERLVERESVGWVYASMPHPDTFVPQYTHADQKEYRATQKVEYLHAIQTSVYDLSAKLIILDGPDEAMWEYLRTFKYALCYDMHAKRLGVTALYAYKVMPELLNTHCPHDSMFAIERSDATAAYSFRLCHSDDRLAAPHSSPTRAA